MAEFGETAPFGYKPLYLQVKDSFVQRLVGGSWQPGQMIPSEIELAREMGVSQGTVRKALDAMTAENLLLRRQGRGTYVAEPEESRILFQFFRLTRDSGERLFPTSRVLSCRRGAAQAEEAAGLAIAENDPVWRIVRVRSLADRPLIVETIVLAEARFSGIGELSEIPNNVYRLYSQRWGVTIARARERLKAVAASPDDAAELGCAPGTPLLEIGRIAFDLESRPVELRVSRCLTDGVHYISELR